MVKNHCKRINGSIFWAQKDDV